MNELLKQFADNDRMMQAVKEVILKRFVVDYDDISKLAGDELAIGRLTRVAILGREAVESAFQEIALSKTITSKPEQANPGR